MGRRDLAVYALAFHSELTLWRVVRICVDQVIVDGHDLVLRFPGGRFRRVAFRGDGTCAVTLLLDWLAISHISSGYIFRAIRRPITPEMAMDLGSLREGAMSADVARGRLSAIYHRATRQKRHFAQVGPVRSLEDRATQNSACEA